MTKLEQIEKSVAELSPEEFERFTAWFETLQAARWDRELAEDAASGALDELAERALSQFRSNRTRPL
ncbi:hypothetical protein [Shinella sp.]|uniref:hypothetical protein n=1 Tax=unclassified Shinella TaxID=2643062 RepID=UPI0028A9A3E1|nr:hypothetical protein [Shinella sp.]